MSKLTTSNASSSIATALSSYDWESGIITAFQLLLSRANKTAADSSTSRTDLLKLFVQVESAIQSANPTMLYADVLAKVHSTIASDHFGLAPSADEDANFGASIADWEPFPESRDALLRRNFQFALNKVREEWGVEAEQVMPTAQSLFHDHVPANKLDLKSSWIARRGSVVGAKESDLEEQGVKVTYTWKFETLGAMADEVEKQFGESGEGA
ncbi:hypothetical protein FRC05_007722 [Tulasnella sp. 425]|nr:hypothetical protein FRC05_007722 [Tulasnella sp. 425]